MYYWAEYGDKFLEKIQINGMFAFVIYDRTNHKQIAARDHIGIIPLYIGWSRDGSVWIASEMKALIDSCERFELFRPGHYYSSIDHKWTRQYRPDQLVDPVGYFTQKYQCK